jgi:thiosulfate dehydrogenase [quinone] large subunit
MRLERFWRNQSTIEDPPIAKFLFGSTIMAWVWLPLRLWLGYQWIESGWGKFTNPDWLNTGVALKSFWERAIVTTPKPVAAFDWYRGFLEFLLNTGAYTWFAKIVLFSEMAIGIALILGAFTGLAAFGGGLLNWNFVMAGSASTNGLMFAVATWLVLAWKTAGWIGLDRWILPMVTRVWRPAAIERAQGHDHRGQALRRIA